MTKHSWLKAFQNRLLSSRGSRSSRVSMARPRSIPIVLEKLEDRTLLAAAVQFGNGVLQVLSDADEDIVIREDLTVPGVLDVRVDGIPASSLGSVTTDQVTSIIVTVGASENTVDLTAVTAAAFPNVASITVSTGNGDDVILGSPDFANDVEAGDGDDLLIGGGLDDSLDAGDGDDTINGGAGNDLLDAGDGDDFISGGDGADTLLGDDGEDTLLGGLGSDNIQAGNGRDILNGGDGDDTLNGGGGADTVFGGPTAGLTITSPAGGQAVTFNELTPSAGSATISIDFVDAAPMSGTLVSSVTGIGTSAVLITIELGDDGTAITATGSDIVAAVNADATASSLVTAAAAGPEEVFVPASLGALGFSSGGGGSTVGTGSFGTPIQNFAGAGFNGVFPPDTVGDVGPDQFIQMINDPGGTLVSIFNKDSTAAFAPFNLSALAPGGSTVDGAGDPIVVYDELADRWVLMEFSGRSTTDPDEIYVYVSQTPTPTNNAADWFFFEFTFPVPGTGFPDYPKLSVWPDGYYITTNEAGTSDPPVYVLDRVNMLQGLTPQPFQRVTTPALAGFGFQALTPVDQDGPTAPPLNNPAYMLRHRDDEAHNPGANDPNQDFVELYAYSTDLANAANSTFQLEVAIPVAEFDSDLNGLTSFSAITQPGGNTPLDPLREVVMWRPSYRNFGTHETIVGNFVTDVDGTDRAGVRWFELRRTGGGAWTLFQEGTISPDNDNRWMGAIAMDASGNIALAYSVSGPTTNPGLRYIGRRASDPLGTMPRGEFVIIDGLSPQVGVDRWGDYHSMSVDPSDGSTFWFTGQYGANNAWTTQVATFAFAASVTTTTPAPSGVDDDLIFGGGGDDALFGLAGDDRIRGNGGDDSILAGDGDDDVHGQNGADTIFGEAGDDTVNGGSGNDTLEGGEGNDTALGGGGNDLVVGDSLDVTLMMFGDDSLNGQGGDDTVIGIFGRDTILGGTGDDLLQSRLLASQVTVAPPAQPPTTVTFDVDLADLGDTLDGQTGRDTIFGAGGNDLITGRSGPDLLNGGLGSDTILGGSGNDTLNGGLGADSLVGQGGNDVLNGGDGNDILRWDGLGDGRDTVFGGNGSDQALASLSNAGNTVTIGQDVNGRLTVTEQSAVLTVDNATVNSVVVRGNNGADRITVGALNLVGRISLLIDGGNGNDTIDAMGSNIGSVALQIMGGVGADTLGGGPSNDRISGGEGDDSIVGRNGRDTLFGNDGADTINGGADNDVINGGANNDTIIGETGDDRIDGGLDSDDINGGDGNDTLMGNFGDDLLNGMAGNDSLLGGSGQDMMLGGAGMDTLDGGRNNDTLRGQAGNDTLRGNHGDDLLEGDDGNDELVGGDGNDTIRGSNGNDGIAGGDGDDLLIGGTGEDTIQGEDGDDTLRGGGGKDTLVGDQGIDVLNGNGGTDLGVTGEGIDPTPIRVEIIDENFTLSLAMLMNLDGV